VQRFIVIAAKVVGRTNAGKGHVWPYTRQFRPQSQSSKYQGRVPPYPTSWPKMGSFFARVRVTTFSVRLFLSA
jgi:hypothetical protein